MGDQDPIGDSRGFAEHSASDEIEDVQARRDALRRSLDVPMEYRLTVRTDPGHGHGQALLIGPDPPVPQATDGRSVKHIVIDLGTEPRAEGEGGGRQLIEHVEPEGRYASPL